MIKINLCSHVDDVSYRDCLLKNLSISNEESIDESAKKFKFPPGLDITLIDLEDEIINQKFGLTLGLDHLRKNKLLSQNLSIPINKYPDLTREINKIRSLSSFKNNLIEHIIRYCKSHKICHTKQLKYIRRQMLNHFTNWFFNLNLLGDIVNFIPIKPFEIQSNLDYILEENNLKKKTNFDQKMLVFDPIFIKNIIQVNEIQIKETGTNCLNYKLINNGPTWSLLSLTKKQHNLLWSKYISDPQKFLEHTAILLLRYKFLGGINNHLSVPPSVYQRLKIDVELFGSPFNVSLPKYCSPFPDIEKHYGSLGSFADFKLQSNQIYAANPPYDVSVMTKMAKKIINELPNCTETTIYITIPLWRVDFPAYNLLINSPYFRDKKELNKASFPFYHYFKNRLIPATDIYLIVMSTTKNNYISCQEISEYWPNGPFSVF